MAANSFKLIQLVLILLLMLAGSFYSHAQEPGASGDPIIMRIIELDHAEAEHLVSVLEPFLSPQGRIMAYSPTNRLIIKDRQPVVNMLSEVIKGRPCTEISQTPGN